MIAIMSLFIPTDQRSRKTSEPRKPPWPGRRFPKDSRKKMKTHIQFIQMDQSILTRVPKKKTTSCKDPKYSILTTNQRPLAIISSASNTPSAAENNLWSTSTNWKTTNHRNRSGMWMSQSKKRGRKPIARKSMLLSLRSNTNTVVSNKFPSYGYSNLLNITR